MEDFGSRHNLSYVQVRTRIVNTRRIVKNKNDNLAARMEISSD